MTLQHELASALSASDLISAGICLLIAYLMFKSSRYFHRQYLLGLPIGFSFLALSYILLGLSLYGIPGGEAAGYLGFFARTYGFAFIAGTYFLKGRDAWRSIGRSAVWLFALMLVLALLAFLIIIVPPFLELPSLQIADDYFYVVNLGLVGYIIFCLYRTLKGGKIASAVLLGFGLLLMSQYSGLIWALEDGVYSLTLAHLVRTVGLVMLLKVAARRHRQA